MNRKTRYLIAIIIAFGGFLQFWQTSLYIMALLCDFLILAAFLFALFSFKINQLEIWFYSILTWFLSVVGLFVAPKILSPIAGERDRNVPGTLRAEFGHKDLGIYLTVAQDGELREGDPVTIAATPVQRRKFEDTDDNTSASLICNACYYLFDPHALNPDWHCAQDLPESWRCPDCGSMREFVTAK